MPLTKGSTHKIVDKNIHEMIDAGHSPKQAVAAALKMAGGKPAKGAKKR